MYHHNQRSTSQSRSVSNYRSESRPRNVQRNDNPFEIVRYINNMESGSINLRTLRNFLFPDAINTDNFKFQAVWKILLQNKDNFILSEPQKDPKILNGNEIIWVRTVLGLCRTHCRRGKDGRNRACDEDCAALHVCRIFLLISENICPFNSKKKKCMFGHTFATEHNLELLKAHNLYGLPDPELQRLFRRRPSRSASTLPQICIYYNKPDRKKCSRENCKSLHLCSDFVQQCCEGNCSRNHKLTTPQVTRILDLYAIDKSWTSQSLLEDLKHFMTTRHFNSTSSCGSNDDSDISEFSEPGVPVDGEHPGKASSHLSMENIVLDNPSVSQISSCAGCEDLKREINKMQLNMSWLNSQVKDLRKIVDDFRKSDTSNSEKSNLQAPGSWQTEVNNLTSRMSGMNKSANQVSDSTLPGNASTLSSGEREPKYVRSQPFTDFTGVPPNSSMFASQDLKQIGAVGGYAESPGTKQSSNKKSKKKVVIDTSD